MLLLGTAISQCRVHCHRNIFIQSFYLFIPLKTKAKQLLLCSSYVHVCPCWHQSVCVPPARSVTMKEEHWEWAGVRPWRVRGAFLLLSCTESVLGRHKDMALSTEELELVLEMITIWLQNCTKTCDSGAGHHAVLFRSVGIRSQPEILLQGWKLCTPVLLAHTHQWRKETNLTTDPNMSPWVVHTSVTWYQDATGLPLRSLKNLLFLFRKIATAT